MSGPNFSGAARRHLNDAEHLRAGARYPNADHLSGIAAECGLKAIAADVLGGGMTGIYAANPITGTKSKGHLGRGTLWSEIVSLASGRQEVEMMALLATADPFSNWDVSDRYSDSSSIRQEDVDRHIEGARLVLRALESAKISGMGGRA